MPLFFSSTTSHAPPNRSVTSPTADRPSDHVEVSIGTLVSASSVPDLSPSPPPSSNLAKVSQGEVGGSRSGRPMHHTFGGASPFSSRSPRDPVPLSSGTGSLGGAGPSVTYQVQTAAWDPDRSKRSRRNSQCTSVSSLLDRQGSVDSGGLTGGPRSPSRSFVSVSIRSAMGGSVSSRNEGLGGGDKSRGKSNSQLEQILIASRSIENEIHRRLKERIVSPETDGDDDGDESEVVQIEDDKAEEGREMFARISRLGGKSAGARRHATFSIDSPSSRTMVSDNPSPHVASGHWSPLSVSPRSGSIGGLDPSRGDGLPSPSTLRHPSSSLGGAASISLARQGGKKMTSDKSMLGPSPSKELLMQVLGGNSRAGSVGQASASTAEDNQRAVESSPHSRTSGTKAEPLSHVSIKVEPLALGKAPQVTDGRASASSLSPSTSLSILVSKSGGRSATAGGASPHDATLEAFSSHNNNTLVSTSSRMGTEQAGPSLLERSTPVRSSQQSTGGRGSRGMSPSMKTSFNILSMVGASEASQFASQSHGYYNRPPSGAIGANTPQAPLGSPLLMKASHSS